ncbi:MAG: S1C family serine protease [Anaerolineae bacterium]
MMRRQTLIAVAILALIALGCGVAGAGAFDTTLTADRQPEAGPNPGPQTLITPVPPPTLMPSPTPLPAAAIAQADAEESLLINLYERVNPSVVNIEVLVQPDEANLPPFPEGEVPEDFDFFQQPFPNQGQGSGFVYDRRGHIVTNNHVVADADQVFVTFHDGTTVPAEVIGTDLDSDLAVLKVDVPRASLRPVMWGDSDVVRVGQRAVAIGNPFGLAGTLTSGIVSGVSRSLPANRAGYRIPEIVQTDAAINPGNSGGPLLNSQGEVIGVNSAIVPRPVGGGERSFLGVGFAIPGNLAQRVIPALIEEGRFQHPWIGFRGRDLTPEIADAMNLPTARGALVIDVVSNSPAAKAGLQGGTREVELSNGFPVVIGGDVIIGIGDEEVRVFDDLLSFLSRKGEVGEEVMLSIIRGGEVQELPLTLGARPRESR